MSILAPRTLVRRVLPVVSLLFMLPLAGLAAAPPPPAELLTKDVYADGGWAWRN